MFYNRGRVRFLAFDGKVELGFLPMRRGGRIQAVWRVKKGLNVICLCRYAEIEDWPTTYSRVSINVKTAGQVMFLGHAPDLDSRWQTVIVTESLLFTLQDMLAMKLGLRFIRQGDAVTLARGRWVLKIYPQSTESYWTAGGCLNLP